MPSTSNRLCRHCTHCQPYSFYMPNVGTGNLRTENVCVKRVVSFPQPCESWEREPGADDA